MQYAAPACASMKIQNPTHDPRYWKYETRLLLKNLNRGGAGIEVGVLVVGLDESSGAIGDQMQSSTAAHALETVRARQSAQVLQSHA
jgi:hypothetical protein